MNKRERKCELFNNQNRPPRYKSSSISCGRNRLCRFGNQISGVILIRYINPIWRRVSYRLNSF